MAEYEILYGNYVLLGTRYPPLYMRCGLRLNFWNYACNQRWLYPYNPIVMQETPQTKNCYFISRKAISFFDKTSNLLSV